MINCVAPNSCANFNFSSSRSTAITGFALLIEAACMAHNPTPPTPNTATDSPGFTCAVFITAPAPVKTAHPTIQDISVGYSLSIGTT